MNNYDPILGFEGDYRFLSNFWPLYTKVYYLNLPFPTVEHAYQYAKLDMDPFNEAYDQILEMTPGQVKRWSHGIKPTWTDSTKLAVMSRLVSDKFTKDPDLMDRLLATGDREIIEGNTWGDRYWGKVMEEDGAYRGKNNLGLILMSIRTRQLVFNGGVK